MNRLSAVGRAALERRTQQIPDVLSDPEYGRQDLQRLGGYRTLLSAPMILGDEVVGVLGMWRTERRALRRPRARAAGGVRRAGRDRAASGRPGARPGVARRRAGQQGRPARGAAGGRRGGQLEPRPRRGPRSRSSPTPSGSPAPTAARSWSTTTRRRPSGSGRAYGSSRELLERLRAVTIRRESTLVGRTALERRPLEVPDLAETELDPHLEILFRDGWRSVLAVPMLRDDRMIGVLVIRRRTPGHLLRGRVRAAAHLRQPVGAGDRERPHLPGARDQDPRARGRQPPQVGVPGQHVPRAAHPAQRRDRLLRGAASTGCSASSTSARTSTSHDIWNSGKHLLELLNEILDLSKVEAGQMVLEPTTFSVARRARVRPLARAGAGRRPRHHARRWRSPTTRTSSRPTSCASSRCVLNLVSNAVKFTPDGGSVQVRADREGDELLVSVTDTGIGVAPEDQERIFESFQQGGRGAPKEEGTGLGLTLSRRIVELFGGRIWLASAVGSGSTFGFAIPVAAGPAGRATGSAGGRGRAAGRAPGRRRPGLPRPGVGLPVRERGPGGPRPRRRRGPRARPPGVPRRGRPGHPASPARRVGGADASSRATRPPRPSPSWSPRSSTSAPGASRWGRPSTCSSPCAATTCSAALRRVGAVPAAGARPGRSR